VPEPTGAEPTGLVVLHALRLVGVASAEEVARRAGSDVARAEAVLHQLRAGRLVELRSGRFGGWLLTAAGRVRGEDLLAAELDRLGTRDVLEGAYSSFLELNPLVLRACSDWQVRRIGGAAGSAGGELVLNDHLDAGYDAAVLDRLGTLHAQAGSALARAEVALERFAPYRPRLANALARARAGGLDWVTKPLIDSFHTVWFELHEDLLATLGRRRADERENGPTADPGGAADPRAGTGSDDPHGPAGPAGERDEDDT
jgi:hypothetical protein